MSLFYFISILCPEKWFRDIAAPHSHRTTCSIILLVYNLHITLCAISDWLCKQVPTSANIFDVSEQGLHGQRLCLSSFVVYEPSSPHCKHTKKRIVVFSGGRNQEASKAKTVLNLWDSFYNGSPWTCITHFATAAQGQIGSVEDARNGNRILCILTALHDPKNHTIHSLPTPPHPVSHPFCPWYTFPPHHTCSADLPAAVGGGTASYVGRKVPAFLQAFQQLTIECTAGKTFLQQPLKTECSFFLSQLGLSCEFYPILHFYNSLVFFKKNSSRWIIWSTLSSSSSLFKGFLRNFSPLCGPMVVTI